MYPHERSLVKHYADRPFTIIGVNSDSDREAIQEVMAKEKITWRSFWNDAGSEGKISDRWNVSGWPTLFLLDAEGRIAAKWLGAPPAEELEALIERLVKAAEDGQSGEPDRKPDSGEADGRTPR